MDVFISQSREPSKSIALALKNWIPSVLQHVDVWVSESDIAAGTRWRKELDNELEGRNFGIVCLTQNNLEAPWILFEAGALSKLGKSRVCTFLYKLENAEVAQPLGHFQHNNVDRNGTWNIIKSINDCSEESKLDDVKLKKSFDQWYPELEKELDNLPQLDDQNQEKRPQEEMVREILNGVRELLNRNTSEINVLQQPYFVPGGMHDTSGLRKPSPALLDEMISQMSNSHPSTSSKSTIQIAKSLLPTGVSDIESNSEDGLENRDPN